MENHQQAMRKSPWEQSQKQAAEGITFRAERKFRSEIQGLRALAVLLVVAYHFWFGRVSGGVDVFLLISAFLMAGSFARKIENGQFKGFRGVWEYWIHVFKRILPLASVTVVGVLAGSYLVLPQDRWYTLISEAKSVVFYYENWWSISNLVDYYAADTGAASPFRHFWSLSVQGQIYVLWPLIFLVSALVVRVLRLNVRVALTVVFGAVFALSLAYSIYITASDQQVAYYNTFARLWEFALGSLVAFMLPWLIINRYVRAVLGWVGIAMIVSCGFIFEVEGVFPGYHALWPTFAASMVIVAGDTGTRFGPEKLLTLRPLLAIGSFSYALYLVHWPLLVFFLYRNHAEKAGVISGVGLLAISMVLAYVLTRWVEAPLRSWKRLDRSHFGALGVITACVALAVVPAYGWQAKINRDVAEAERLAPYNNPGAQSLEAGFVYRGAENPEKLPIGEKRITDFPVLDQPCDVVDPTIDLQGVIPEHCFWMVKNQAPEKLVIAAGNSHIHMWSDVLIYVAEQENWDLMILTRGWCHYGAPEFTYVIDDCDSTDESWTKFIESQNPDAVVMLSSVGIDELGEQIPESLSQRIESLTSQGIDLVGIRDTPRLPEVHRICLEDGGTDEDCTFEAGQDVYSSPSQYFEEEYPGYGDMNLSDIVCPEGLCPPSIGNVYTFFDTHHVSTTYAVTAREMVHGRVLEALGRAEAHRMGMPHPLE